MRNVPKKPGRLVAALLAVAVHIALALFLIFGVQWQNKYAEQMTVEVVPPMPLAQTPPPPQPVVKPPPEPPPPVAQPPVVPPVVPPAAPLPVKTDPRPVAKLEPSKADIALKARQERERLERERLEKERLDKQKREQEKLAQEKREREVREIAKREADKRERDVREAEKREADRRSLEELKLAQERAGQEAELRQRREVQAQREREQRERLAAQEAAARAAATKAHADYVNRIQAKIRGNVILPPDIAGNPEGVFDVVQLPTGDIISAEIRKSSGSRIYDDAVLRAILKSSPLPKPDPPEQVQRNLTLKFRPQE
jgi:colicin import membrane protein